MDGAPANLDREHLQVSLDERRFTQESEARNRELALREREVAAKEAEHRRPPWLNPTVIGLYAATLALIGNLIVALLNNRAAHDIERDKAQSSLIIQAVGTGNAQAACQNLRFFIRLGLLDDPRGIISQCESSPGSTPVLPANSLTYSPAPEQIYDQEMAAVVTRTKQGDLYRFDVTFTVPNPGPGPYAFDLITVYAFKNIAGKRQGDLELPSIKGNWKPGDRVTFSTTLSKAYVEDPVNKCFLRFCVGSKKSCIPSVNLLLP